MNPLMTGTILARRYRLEDRLASGGMGTVWRAYDEVLHRPVAVKLLHDALADDPAAAERFRREALTAASISHPNMANVYDYIEEDGRPGIVMELVDGETLADRIRREGALPLEEAVRITAGTLSALDAAHRAGVVHRDVKPANIIITVTGDVKVADFGIARAAGESSITRTGSVMASPHYVAPEQLRGEPATPASDLYAAGIVLYEALVGVRPFTGDTPVGIAMARLSQDVDPPHLHADVSAPVSQVVMRALAREAAHRFPSALAFRHALEHAARAPADEDVTTDVPITGTPGPLAAAAVGGTAPAAPIAADDAVTTALEPRLADSTTTLERGADGGAATTVLERASRRRAPRRAARRSLGLVAMVILILALGLGVTRLVASEGLAKVPAFTGMTVGDAQAVAAKHAVIVRVRRVASPQPKDIVVDQSIAPGTEVRSGTSVDLEVSLGCCKVPAVTGLSAADARTRIERARLRVGAVRYEVSALAPGTVTRQTPTRGAVARPGATVALVVAKAPEPPPRQQSEARRNGGDDEEDEGGADGSGGEGKKDKDVLRRGVGVERVGARGRLQR